VVKFGRSLRIRPDCLRNLEPHANAMSERSTEPERGSILGIVGGMGPLASAELLRTIYRLHTAVPEQASPTCILHSDPAFPDRTAAIREGRTEVLAERLSRVVADLVARGASRVVIACVTVHCVLASLPAPLRQRVISLIDLTVGELLSAGTGPFLLLATSGTRAARIFERHELWGAVAERVRPLEERDQEELHAWIYRLKVGEPGEPCLDWLVSLRRRYGAAGLVFGCTELHLLREPIAARGGESCCGRIVDPLWIVARDLPKLLTRDERTLPARPHPRPL
jgi:aspartate racemase